MRSWKKLIAMLLAVGMLATLLVGCSSGGGGGTSQGICDILAETTNDLRKEAGLKKLTYNEELSTKAAKIINLFKANADKVTMDEDGMRLDGTAYDTLMHELKLYDEYETYQLMGAWGDDVYDEENEIWNSTGGYLCNEYRADLKELPLLRSDLTWQIMWEGETSPLMNKVATEVGYAVGEVNGHNYWVAIVKKGSQKATW